METLDGVLQWLQSEVAVHGAYVLAMQLLVVLGALAIAWLILRKARESLFGYKGSSNLTGFRDWLLSTGLRLAFPISLLIGLLIGRLVYHLFGFETDLLDVLAQLVVALALIRALVYTLRKGLEQGPGLKAWEFTISTSIWVLVALHLVGWLEPMLAVLDSLALELGDSRISLLMIARLVFWFGLYLLLAFWVSGLAERRLQRARNINPSMRVGLAKAVKLFLLGLAVLMALNEAGLNLASLAVFGGALGVGIGFGLQKIVSNFISGFILLGDRSIRPGDVITVGGTYGWVKQLRARYIVVCNRDGVETLIPNENLVTSEVINWSFTDRQVRVKIPVQVSYADDPEQAMDIMRQAARANPRVLNDPAPTVNLMEFADSGIALELRIWLSDPENGIGSVRSDINRAIWKGFREAGITIPFPQRDVHLHYPGSSPATAG